MTMLQLAWTDEADQRVALPSYETQGAAGADLRANFAADQRDGISLSPGARALIPTGLRLAIPRGFEVQLRPRSGLALKHAIKTISLSAGNRCMPNHDRHLLIWIERLQLQG